MTKEYTGNYRILMHKDRQARPHHHGATAMTLPELSAELLPCPFCGAQNRGDMLDIYPSSPSLGRAYWAVQCDDCGAQGPTVAQYNSADPDVLCEKAWNTRTGQLVERDGVAGVAEKLRQGLDHHDRFGPLPDRAAVYLSITGEVLYELPYEGGRLTLGDLRAALTAIKGGVDDADG